MKIDHPPPSRPSPAAAARHRLDGPHESDFDALTDLFLGERSSAPTPNAAAPAPAAPAEPALRATVRRTSAIVECIVLGHLPVLGSAWAAQYAREVAAAAHRTVAFLRIDDGLATVELIDDPTSPTPAPPTPTAATFDEAVRIAAAHASRWIVRGSEDIEHHLASSPHVRMVTLLSSPDEAARVAGYAAVKALAAQLPTPSADGLPMIRVAMMGAGMGALGGQRAADAADRIVEAVRVFLSRDAQRADCSGQIRSSRPARLIYSGECHLAPQDAIESIAAAPALEHTHTPPAPPAATPESEPEPVLKISAESAAEPEPDTSLITLIAPGLRDAPAPSEPAPEPADVGDIDRSAEQHTDDATTTTADAPTNEVQPLAPSADPSPRTAAATTTIDLGDTARPAEPLIAGHDLAPEPPAASIDEPPTTARTLELKPSPAAPIEPWSNTTSPTMPALHTLVPGLSPIRLRCPHAHGVDIALDARGRCHLLAHAPEGAEAAGVMSLTIAAGWLAEHAEPLGLSNPAPPVQHLFSPAPKRVRALLWSALRMHLLKPVRAGDAWAWCCEPLN